MFYCWLMQLTFNGARYSALVFSLSSFDPWKFTRSSGIVSYALLSLCFA